MRIRVRFLLLFSGLLGLAVSWSSLFEGLQLPLQLALIRPHLVHPPIVRLNLKFVPVGVLFIRIVILNISDNGVHLYFVLKSL